MLTDCVSVTIDGFPDYLHKLSLAERPAIPSPEKQVDVTTVKGRLGALYQHYSYDDVDFKMTFNYLEDVQDYQAFKEKFYIIRQWLYNGTWLQFSDEPNIEYKIMNVSIDDADNEIMEWGSFDVSLTLAPFGRVVEDVPITVENNNEFTLLNNSLQPSYPKLIITPTKDVCGFVLNDKRFDFTGLTIGKETIIDSQLMLTYEIQADGDMLDKSSNMQTLEYPVLKLDVNNFYLINISKIKIFRNAMR